MFIYIFYRNMKVYLPIVVFLLGGVLFESIESAKKLDIDGLKDMLKPMSKSCKKKSGLSDEILAGTLHGEWPREKPLMCFFKCLAIMLKAMNKNGELTVREANRQLDILVVEDLAPRLKEILSHCAETVTSTGDSCEYAFDLMVCGYNSDPALYFVP